MTENTEEGMWDLAPPNTPLKTDWPPLERTIEPPIRHRKSNGWKKWKKQKKRLATELLEQEEERARSLDRSLMVSPEEQDRLMQLANIFDRLELGVIIAVLRAVNGDLSKAIDQCLTLTTEMELEEARAKLENSSSSGDESSLQSGEEDVSFSVASLKSPEKTERSQIFSLADSMELQLEDFEELAAEEDEEDEEEEEEEEDQEEETQDKEVEDEDLNGWSQGSLGSSSPLPDEDDIDKSKELNPKNPTVTFTVMGEDFELPTIPAQDSEVEKWLKEFDSSRFLRRSKSADSLSESGSIRESAPLLDSSVFCSFNPETLGDSDRVEDSSNFLSESLPNVDLKLSSELARDIRFGRYPQERLPEERPYWFALEERAKPKCSLSINQPVVSVGIDPKEQPETVSLQYHEEKVAELLAAKKQVEEEKKRAMSWCIDQIRQVTEEKKEKESTIERQTEEIERQRLEIEKLTKQLEGMKTDEKDLHSLFLASKEMIVEGVQSLQQNINKGIAKVETDWVILEKVREFEVIEKVKDLDLVEKVKKLASSIKEEISSAFSSLEASVQNAVHSRSEQQPSVEEKQMWMAEKASLESYVQELEERIRILKENSQYEEKVAQVKETEIQVDKVETEAQGTNTLSVNTSVSSQTSSPQSDYGESYRFFQQEFRQLWDRQSDAFSFEE